MYHLSVCCLCLRTLVVVLLVVCASSGDTDIEFDSRVYQHSVPHEDVQTSTCLVATTLTRPLDPDESVTASSLVGIEDVVSNFTFNSSTFSVCNSAPLNSGRYEFSLVVIINDNTFLLSSLVIDVLSPGGTACEQQVFGKCSQSCQENATSSFGYDCSCSAGYILQSDSFTCLAFDPSPQLVVSTANSVVLQTLLPSATLPILSSSIQEITAFDYSSSLEVLYFVTSENGSSTLSTVPLDASQSSPPKLVFTFPEATVTDIAVDWTNEDLYYLVDSSSLHVLRSGETQLVTDALDSARGLTFSYVGRRIIWTSNSSLTWISLNEDNTATVINNIQPSAVSVDPVNGYIYCVNGSSIVSVDLLSNMEVVLQFESEVPVALDVFEIFAYVVFDAEEIRRVNIYDSSEDAAVVHVEAGALNVKVLHPLKQPGHPRGELSCGDCDHSCAIFDQQLECVCDTGFKLSSDGHSCFPAEALEFIFSSYSSENLSAIVSVNPRSGGTRQLLKTTYPDGPNTSNTGVIYGIDYDPRHSRLFYGDRDSAAIWTVSVSGVSSVQDDRSLVVANASVWDLTYDWLNAYLYWTEDRYNVVARIKVGTNGSDEYDVIQSGTELRGIVVDPVHEWLFWIDEQVIFRTGLDGTNRTTFTTCVQPLALAIDYVTNRIFWTDGAENSVRESTLDGASQTIIFSDESFDTFFVNVVRNLVVVTSQTNASYALINLDDTSVAYVKTNSGNRYFGISVTGPLKQPSVGQSSCLEDSERCSHFCEVDEVDMGSCACPDDYTLLDDGTTCVGIQSCSLCPNDSVCYNVGRNVSCECPLSSDECCEQLCENGQCQDTVCQCDAGYMGEYCESECLPGTFGEDCSGVCGCVHGVCDVVDGSCSCDSGYTGSQCDIPICDFTCLNGGECAAPNECQCEDSFTGSDCSERMCTPTFCHNGGTCLEIFGGVECRCPSTTSGPQCQFDEVIVIPIGPEVKVGAPIGVFLFVLMVAITTFLVIYWLYWRYKREKNETRRSSSSSSKNLTLTSHESITYASMESARNSSV